MLGLRNVLEASPLAACGALFILSACSGAEFTGGAGEAGKSNLAGSAAAGQASGGSSAGGTTGGDAGETSGGAPDSGGSTGTGGTVPGSCDCPEHHYCRDGSFDCFPCAEINRLNFSTPERLATVSDNGDGSHFPRVGSTGTDLLYRFEGTGLRYTADASTSAGSTVQSSLATDSAPLLLASDVSGVPTVKLMSFNFVFDRDEGGRRWLYLGQWSNGLMMSERAPVPYNGTSSAFSMAIATKPGADATARAFWMSGDTSPAMVPPPTLYTAILAANESAVPVALSIGQLKCPAKDADLAPWVTSNGKTLLVSHPRLDANCNATGQGKDIYTALLQPATGQPTTPALPMNDVNSPMNDVEPSFSADMCDLYFASDRDGKYALYRAHRR